MKKYGIFIVTVLIISVFAAAVLSMGTPDPRESAPEGAYSGEAYADEAGRPGTQEYKVFRVEQLPQSRVPFRSRLNPLSD